MRGSRFKEEAILAVVKRLESGEPPQKLKREFGVTEQTLYRWKWKYGGVKAADARSLMDLESQLRALRAELHRVSLENRALKMVLRKNW